MLEAFTGDLLRRAWNGLEPADRSVLGALVATLPAAVAARERDLFLRRAHGLITWRTDSAHAQALALRGRLTRLAELPIAEVCLDLGTSDDCLRMVLLVGALSVPSERTIRRALSARI